MDHHRHMLPDEMLIGSLKLFDKIGLDNIGAVSLQNRKDIKFVIRNHQLPVLLARLRKDHFVLEADDARLMGYENIYFDTPDLTCYLAHHNGLLSRYKFRYRRYSLSGLSYFEIKVKSNKRRTQKYRLKHANFGLKLLQQEMDWVQTHSPFDPKLLQPSLHVNFNRITLIDKGFKSRSTIDVNLRVGRTSADSLFENTTIIEVKQNSYDRSVPIQQRLHEMGVHEFRVSKYCMGLLRSHSGLKYNRFKEKRRTLHKLTMANNG